MDPTPQTFEPVAKHEGKSRTVIELVTGATVTIYIAYRLIRRRKRPSLSIPNAESGNDFQYMNGSAENARWDRLAARRFLVSLRRFTG